MNSEHEGMSVKNEGSTVTRRNLFRGAGWALAATMVPGKVSLAETPDAPPSPGKASGASTDLTGELARYMVAAREQNLPPKVMQDGKHRVLDALGAMVSGSRLKPGEAAIRFIRTQGGVQESSVFGTDIKTSAINASLVNGMLAHADETDDVDPLTKAHPGAGVVPAAVAMAEREQRSGLELLRAVVLGYDVGCRFIIALENDAIRKAHRGIEAPVSTMGAMAAAASLAGSTRRRCAMRSPMVRNR